MERLKAVYTRVSTKEQALNTNALKQQREQMAAFGASLSYEDVESGSNDDRPDFVRLLADIKAGKISELFIRDFTRIARNGKTNREILELLKTTGTKLYVLYSGRYLDLNDPDDWYLANNQGSLAERESAILSKRVRRGFAAKRAKGLAGSHAPFGYVIKNGKYCLDHTKCKKASKNITNAGLLKIVVKTILESGSYRAAYKKVLEEYGYCPRNLPTLMKRAALRGHTGYGWQTSNSEYQEYVYNTHEAVITQAEYERLLKRNKKNIVRGKKWRESGVFSGFVFCGKCQKAFQRSHTKSSYPDGQLYSYWRCGRRQRFGDCDNPQISDRRLWLLTSQAIVEHSQQFLEASINAETQKESARIIELKNKITNYKEANQDGDLDNVIAKLQKELESELQQDKNLGDKEQLIARLSDFIDIDFFLSMNADERKEVLLLCIEKIVILNKNAVFSFTF